jgi:hypothetical protein
MLTSKQEKFCQCLADGMSQSDAYRTAFNVGAKTKHETINKRASELMKSGDVSGRVAELRAKLSEKALWTREMSVRALMQAYQVAEVTENSAGMTGAIKELNAMHGYNAAKQVQLSGVDGAPLGVVVEFVKT